MWSVVSRVGQLLGLVSSEPIVDLDDIAAVLDAAEDSGGELETAQTTVEEEDGVRCQHRVGVITQLTDVQGYINSGDTQKSSQLWFRREDGPDDLSVGNKVVYLAFRMSAEEVWKVRKVLYVLNELWDQEEGEEDLSFNDPAVKEECEVAYKHVIAKMTGREGRTIIADSLRFSLDSVKIDFIPVEGDWLMLESLVQTEKAADTLLTVDRVSPLRSRTVIGRVSHWVPDTQQGIVDCETAFVKEACEPGYQPRVGDQVRVCCIESEQGLLTWRAVTVVPVIDRAVEISHDPRALATLLMNKEGIVISEDTNCGIVNMGQEKQLQVEIKNEKDTSHTLREVEFTSSDQQFTLCDPPSVDSLNIPPKRSTHLVFTVKGRFVGPSTELVILKFQGFEIGRQLVVEVQSKILAMTLPSKPQGKSTSNIKNERVTAKKLLATRNGFIIPGVRPLKPANFVPVHLPRFTVPDKLINLVIGDGQSKRFDDIVVVLQEQYECLREALSERNYVARWDLLVHLEDLEHMVNISRYNRHASLHRVQDYLCLEIPGLAERRPSLLVGDKITAREAWSDENSWASDDHGCAYEGYIHKVLSNQVLLKFNPSFHMTCSGVYALTFEASRASFRREHQAVQLAYKNLGPAWLFPSQITCQLPQIVITSEEDHINPKRTRTDSKTDKSSNDKVNKDIFNEEVSKLNGDKGLSNDVVSLKVEVENSIDDILNTATTLVNKREEILGNVNGEEFVQTCKNKVSYMIEKDEAQQKVSPPRVPVIDRFLQRERNSPLPLSTEKSPKEVKSMLQQLANCSTNKQLPAAKCEMKTLEEIEKSLLNGSSNNILEGIKPLSGTHKNLHQKLKNRMNSNCKEESLKTETLLQAEKTNLQNNGDNRKALHGNNSDSNQSSYSAKDRMKWNSNDGLKRGDVKESDSKISSNKKKKLFWFNSSLNYYQKEAVRNIVRGEARPLPYVIFGPPGTGKTITLVETILQIYCLVPESRILVGAPSNSAADLLSERLLDTELLAPGDLLRLVGYHYAEQGRVPERLRPYCGTADIKDQGQQTLTEGVVNISRHAIGRHRITVGTCNTLGVLYQMGFPRGHFTHVMLDEAGQATEPEILIPLAFLHSSYGQVVLAGDPLQLGPVVLNKPSDKLGRGESLLSRLLQRTAYRRDPTGYPATGGFNPLLVTRLLCNYRSLPQILVLPNTMFYDGDLIPQVSEEKSAEADALARLKAVLPPRPDGAPPALLFHGVRGTNCQGEDSPSWHNPHEAVQVAMYLQSLYDSGLSPDDCGIITPYQAQVFKICQILDTLEIQKPKVGSVEEFQGQERMAIILSAVRSSPRLIESDVRHTVGFVASPRRLNVAISRARAVLIIIGNPHLLARDQYWRAVLSHCVRQGAYTGCDRPNLDSEQNGATVQ